MGKSVVNSIPLPELPLWEKIKNRRTPLSFELEITARCNNNCRHCYINLPAGDVIAKEKELSLRELDTIAEEAVSLGALWCLVTGGEPLLRKDFFDIFLLLKRHGLLVSIFTNATLITAEHIKFFKKYPPRDIEVSVYGVTKETYERVTRKPGSFRFFMKGVGLLLNNGIKVRFKAMALRSNIHEMVKISHFCLKRTKDYYRFDPFLHMRYDRDPIRNKEIRSERLSPEEISALEKSDSKRFESLKKRCGNLIVMDNNKRTDNKLFRCGIGKNIFNVSYNGFLRLCPTLWHPNTIYDLRTGNLLEAWQNLYSKIMNMRSVRNDFLEKCGTCHLLNLCMWCPATSYLETGKLDSHVKYFCEVAHERAKMIMKHDKL